MPILIAPAISSATPPSTTSLESPIELRPAVRAKGTVKPSDKPMTLKIESRTDKLKSALKKWPSTRLTYTSRTTAGSISVRSSSPFRSLQQIPSRPSVCLAHLAGRGVWLPEVGACPFSSPLVRPGVEGGEESDQIGGLGEFASGEGDRLRGSGTDGTEGFCAE
jgi:hypothetical protein